MEYKQLLQEYKDAYNQYIKTSELLAKDFQFYLTIHEELYEKIFYTSLCSQQKHIF